MGMFWTENPCALIQDLTPVPTCDMSKEDRLNALTRLVLLVSLYLYWKDNKQWHVFLGAGLAIIILIHYSKPGVREGFSVNPTYSGADYTTTIVAPVYAEEWHEPPPEYELIDTLVEPEEIYGRTRPIDPRRYPYGQYFTNTNLLPSQERDIHEMNLGLTKTREFINDAYTRRDVAFRDDMMRIHRKKLERRFRHNCNDTFSPYTSY